MEDLRASELPGHEIPIDGTLDLHAFDPREVGELIPVYLEECRKRGILTVRIIHGKGRGILRRRVQTLLDRLPEVGSYRLAEEYGGGWGATVVELRAPASFGNKHDGLN